jgi:predicted DNA-binding protein YlxM (UPF0122 family)
MVILSRDEHGKDLYSYYIPYNLRTKDHILDSTSASLWTTTVDPLEELILEEEFQNKNPEPMPIPDYNTLEERYLSVLNDRDRRILWLHFTGHTQAQIAKEFNVTQCNIAQLFKRLNKCLKLLAKLEPLTEEDLSKIEHIIGHSPYLFKNAGNDTPTDYMNDRAKKYIKILRSFAKTINQSRTADETGLRQCSVLCALRSIVKRIKMAGYSNYVDKINNLLILSKKKSISGLISWSDERKKSLRTRMKGNCIAHTANMEKRNLPERPRPYTYGQTVSEHFIEINGEKVYHNLKGPALIEWGGPNKVYRQWWVNGERITHKEFKEKYEEYPIRSPSLISDHASSSTYLTPGQQS